MPAMLRAFFSTLKRAGPWWWLGWLAWTLAGAVLLAQWSLNRLDNAFQTDARIVHRLLSQHATQHDAILNTLALLQPGARGEAAPEIRLPALYPQIIAVQRRAPDQAWPDAELARGEQDSRRLRRAAVAGVDAARGRFDLVLAATPASYALTINLAALAPGADWPMNPQGSPVRVTLEHGGAQYVVQSGAPDVGAPGGWPLDFRKTLAAESQPFDVVARRRVGWGDLPWAAMLAWSALGALALYALASWLRQRAARRRAEELLRLGQIARLNTLGEMAAGIAHELNQPLTAVLAGTQASLRLLGEEPPDLPTVRRAMDQAVAQARRAADVLTRLRRTVEAPASHAAAAQTTVDLAEAARHALALLQPELDRLGVAAQVQAEAPTPARVDPVALDQILHNLLNNALHALGQAPAGERRLTLHATAEGAQARLRVADSGPGIAPQVLARVFEPFFTTREGGLGLGLSLCETLATGQGGALTAGHNTPRGAVFTLTLPLKGTT